MKAKNKAEFEKSVKEKIKLYQGWIAQQKLLLDNLDQVPSLDDLPGKLLASSLETYRYVMPLDHPTVEKIKARMLKEGWKCSYDEILPNSGYRAVRFNKSTPNTDRRFKKGSIIDLALSLYAYADREGSTCERVKIGEKKEMKTVEIFEITCLEGTEVMQP